MNKTYYGKPCKKRGHDGLRFAGNGVCVECNRIASRDRYHANKEARREYHADWLKAHPGYTAWSNAKARAKKFGIPFTIKVTDLPPIPQFCPVLGIPIAFGGEHEYTPSLDRIVPAFGYVQGNVHWLSQRANRIKSDATPEELHLLADYFSALEKS